MNQVSRVGVIGAGGNTGARIAAQLASQHVPVVGLVHSERSASRAQSAGANQTRQLDLQSDGYSGAFDDLDALIFIAPPFDANEVDHVRQALEELRHAAVNRFIYYSVLHADYPDLPHHRRKLDSEALVRDSSVRWTILKPAMYQQTLLSQIQDVQDQDHDGFVRVPYSPHKPFNLVDLADIAETVARVITEADQHDFATYELAGPQRQSMAASIRAVAQATGKTIDLEQVSAADGTPPGLPAEVAAEMRAMFAHYDRSGFPGNSNQLRWLLGREPRSIADTARHDLLS